MKVLHETIENFPIIIPENNDSPRIQRAINYCDINDIGILKATGTYSLGAAIELPSNFKIEGISPIRTRFILKSGVTAFSVYGKRNIVIEDIAIDGEGRVGTRAFTSDGESITLMFRNVWIDSVKIGFDLEFTYFVEIENVRIMGTPLPFLFRNSSNVINLTNCSTVVPASNETEYSGNSVVAFNGSCLNIKGCAFEGEGAGIRIYNWSGANIDGSYFENQSKTSINNSWITLGTGNGSKAKGITIQGCNFTGGFQGAVSLLSIEGLSSNGNVFETDVFAYEMYQYDNSPKVNLDFGQNAYKTGITRIKYLGNTTNNQNSNNSESQITPLLFVKQKEPQNSHIENDSFAIYTTTAGKIESKSKTSTGEVSSGVLGRFVPVPKTSSSVGNTGDWSANSTHLFVCYATNAWRRIAFNAW